MRTLFENGQAIKRTRVADNMPADEAAATIMEICDRCGWEYPVVIPGGGILMTSGLLTEEAATACLKEFSSGNRTIRKGRVLNGANAVKAKRWRRHHQGIAFDAEGKFADGHHRCHIVLEAGMPLWTLIAFNVEVNAKAYIDTNASRSHTDQSKMCGMGLKSDRIAAIKWMVDLPGATTMHITTEQHQMLNSVLDFGLSFFKDVFTKHVSGICKAPVYAAVARASYHEDHDRLRQFVRVLLDMNGTGVDEPDAALRLARELTRDEIPGKGGSALVNAYRRSEALISKFCRYEPGKTLRASKTKRVVGNGYDGTGEFREIYPLPEAVNAQAVAVLGPRRE